MKSDNTEDDCGGPRLDPRLCEGVRVLVIEDDETLGELICDLLKEAGLQTDFADTGEAALSILSGPLPPSLVLSDLVLPGIQGDALVSRIKADNPTTPVIIMSVINSVEQAVSLLKLGADDYLTKPLDFEHLLARISHALESIAMAREIETLETVHRSLRPEASIVWGTSKAMMSAVSQIPMLARTDAPVVVLGESGVGKEIVARAIHYASRRASHPMISVSVAAIPEALWEREFFGHVAGAFSDAGSGAPGIIEAAHGGTLFLDEIGEIPMAMQAKLLRFLQEKEYRRVGDTLLRKADVRIVSATHSDLKTACASGRFREDLYYRLCVLPISVPPLRERKDDLPALATHFLHKYANEYDKPVVAFSPRALHKLASYDFPGNVRELENVVQQSLARSLYSVVIADEIHVGDPSIAEARAPGGLATAAKVAVAPPVDATIAEDEIATPFAEAKAAALAKFELRYVRALLGRHSGNITHAASAAGMTRKSLSKLVKLHGVADDSPELAPKPGRPRAGT